MVGSGMEQRLYDDKDSKISPRVRLICGTTDSGISDEAVEPVETSKSVERRKITVLF